MSDRSLSDRLFGVFAESGECYSFAPHADREDAEAERDDWAELWPELAVYPVCGLHPNRTLGGCEECDS